MNEKRLNEKKLQFNLSGHAPATERLTDIDIAKGLAIILVVFGHIVARTPPANNDWYIIAKDALYSFHMAFFMFLSGIVFFFKMPVVYSFNEYVIQLRKRFQRLMPAYFLFAVIIFLLKFIAQFCFHVDNPVAGWTDLLGIFLYPMKSISSSLWYIYVLFLFCVVGITIASLSNGRIFPIIILGITFQFLPKTPFLCMDQFCKYFIFFSLGGLSIRHWDAYSVFVKRAWIPSLIAFITMLLTMSYKSLGWIPTALLSLIALHGLCKQELPFSNTLRALGLMTFPIYLMNTLSIGFTKAILLKFMPWDGVNFFIFIPILMMAGLWIPLLVKQHFFVKIVWLDKITS